MLEYAGFRSTPMQSNYVKLVDFVKMHSQIEDSLCDYVKDLNLHGNSLSMPATKLLKEISEIKEEG